MSKTTNFGSFVNVMNRNTELDLSKDEDVNPQESPRRDNGLSRPVENNVTVPTVETPTAQAITSTPYITGEKQTYEQWMSDRGYDPDSEYLNAKNQLEYDYMSNSANYGRQAEQLAQMGLSSSGVSDIFQAGAYSSYISRQNDLSNALIAQKKAYRQEYNAYSDAYDANLKADNANAYNFGLGIYDGQNIDAVSEQLRTQGYSENVIAGVAQNLSALDPNSLPTVKAQQEANKTAVQNGYNAVLESGIYKGNNIEDVETELKNQNYSDEQIASIVERLQNSPIQMQLDNARVGAIFDQYYASYTPENRPAIETSLKAKGTDQADIEKAMEKLDEYYNRLPEHNRPDYVDIKGVASTVKLTLASDDYGNMVYSGSDYDKQLVRDILNSQGYSEEADEIIKQMDRDFVGSTLGKIASYSQGGGDTISAAEIVQAYNIASEDDRAEIQDETKTYVENAITNMQALNDAHTFVGVDKATWDGYDAGSKLISVLNTIGALSDQGLLDKPYTNSVFTQWANTQSSNAKDKESKIAFVEQLKEFVEKNYITEEFKNIYIAQMVGTIGGSSDFNNAPTKEALKKMVDDGLLTQEQADQIYSETKVDKQYVNFNDNFQYMPPKQIESKPGSLVPG